MAHAGSAVLDKKLKKVLELRTDTPVMLEALDCISEFWTDNTLEARRGLRHELEHENLVLANKFIESFSPLQARIQEVDRVVDKLDKSCSAVGSRLKSAESAMVHFTDRATELAKQRDELEAHAKEVSDFVEKHSITPEEVDILQHMVLDAGSQVTDQTLCFFRAVERLQAVREECGRLVGSKHQSAAFDLLEMLSKQQEQAYEKIYNWLMHRFEQQQQSSPATRCSEDMDDVDGVVRLAVHALRARPSFYAHCQEAILGFRRTMLVQRFAMAMTIGVGGSSQPIELMAHDPVRYVGDMVSWVHQTVASEKELLRSLFISRGGEGLSSSSSMTSSSPVKSEDTKNVSMLSLKGLLAQVTDGMARPLQVRLRGVLEAQLSSDIGGMVSTCKIHNLLSLYAQVLQKLMCSSPVSGGEPAQIPKDLVTSQEEEGHSEAKNLENGDHAIELALLAILEECKNKAAGVLSTHLRSHGEHLARSPPPVPRDLSTSPAVTDQLRRLGELLEVQRDALSTSTEDETINCYIITTAFLEPLLQTCRLSGNGLLHPSDTATLMINHAAAMQAAVEPYESVTGDWLSKLDNEVKTWVEVLVKDEASRMLEECGLAQLLETAEIMARHGPAAQQMGLEPEAVEGVMRAFYAQLFALIMPTFDKLTPPNARTSARRAISREIVAAHDKVCSLVKDPKNEYPNADACILHSKDQVRVLLDCD